MLYIISGLGGFILAVVIMALRLNYVARFIKWFCDRRHCIECPYHVFGGCKLGNPGGWRLKKK